jgi:hypothetical protein
VSDPVTRGAAKSALLIALPLALVAGLLAFWQLGGFGHRSGGPAATPTVGATGVVDLPVPSLNAGDATMCLAFIAQLPDHLRDRAQRPVSAGGNQQNAAFGDPPITVECGGGPTASYPPDASILLTGVCWWYDQQPAGTAWSTLDRQVRIKVTFPAGFTGQADWIQEFTDPIVASVPSLPQIPSVCTGPSTQPLPSHS